MSNERLSRPAMAFMVAVMLTAATGFAQTKINPGYNLFSPQQDVEIGAQSAQQADAQLPIINDATINNYVNRIGQRLAQNAGGPQFQYRFRVVNQTDINAFALPGGFIYVNRGIIDNARNEGEVAGVLAHEISHVALRHGTHQASKAYLAQAGISILGGILGGGGGKTADIINTVGGVGLNVLFLKYGRDLETQADVRGAQILAASGYAPSDMVSFFQTLERVDQSKKTSWLSDHPAPPDRVARIQKEAAMLHVQGAPTQNVAELRQVQSRVAQVAGGGTSSSVTRNAPAAAATRRRTSNGAAANVSVAAPSGSMRTYTAPSGVYRLSYPSNWQVVQQANTAVTLAPQGGVGQVNGQSEIVYGAIVSHYDPFGNTPMASGTGLRGGASNGNISLQDATNDLLTEIRRSSTHLSPVGNGQVLRMANGTALAVALHGKNPNTGIQERVTVVTRQLADEHLVYLLFVTPEKDAANYQNVLNAMVGSLQVSSAAH